MIASGFAHESLVALLLKASGWHNPHQWRPYISDRTYAPCQPTAPPVHRIRITKPFEMGKYEAAQAQWEAVRRGLGIGVR
jgi:hypothetical protein